MRSMNPAERTVLIELEFAWRVLLIFCRRVITTLAGTACKGNDIPHVNNLNTEKIPCPIKGQGILVCSTES